MNFTELLNDKTLKPKEKTEQLSHWLSKNPNLLKDLIVFAKASKDPVKATCIESIEYVTKIKPEVADPACLEFVSLSLLDKAPRIKWESAKVIGNIAHLYPSKLNEAVNNLLINTEHVGTVVRWSAAYALGEIIQLKAGFIKELVPTLKTVCDREEKNSIKKIYLQAFKKRGV